MKTLFELLTRHASPDGLTCASCWLSVAALIACFAILFYLIRRMVAQNAYERAMVARLNRASVVSIVRQSARSGRSYGD